MLKEKKLRRILALLLCFLMIFSSISCSYDAPTPILSDPNEQILVENIEEEDILVENLLTESIIEEEYLEEEILVENKITEILQGEELIEEVILCQSIFVPQENIEDFSKNSQIAKLFGEKVDITPVLKKVTIGTGVIVTVCVLKLAKLPEPVASVVVAAADGAVAYSKAGATFGSLYGGLTGAADTIDESGRTSAIIAFATATAALIFSVINLALVIPSGGSTTVTLGVSLQIAFAAIGVLTASGGTMYAGKQAIEKLSSTDATDIDWGNIDWEKVGVAAIGKSVENAADGYMWGAIIGAVDKGIEGYEFYHKYGARYSKYNARLQQTPKDGNGGHWNGERGESEFVLDEPLILEDGTVVSKVNYKNAIPDFSPFEKAQVKISGMDDNRQTNNYKKANEALAEYWSKIKFENKTWKRNDVEAYCMENGLTWHEMNNMEYMQLVPTEVNDRFGHLGGVGEYKASLKNVMKQGGSD